LLNFSMRKLRVKDRPLRHSIMMIIRQVIVVLHHKPKGLIKCALRSRACMILIEKLILVRLFALIALESAKISSNCLYDLACIKIYLHGSCLSLPSHYALVLTEEVRQVLVSNIE
jgi:hypothetical protein